MMYGDGNGGWWVGMLLMGVFWIAVIGLMVWGVLRVSRAPDQPPAGDVDSARRVLDRRYAAGEITTEQYAEMRRVLEGHSAEVTRH